MEFVKPQKIFVVDDNVMFAETCKNNLTRLISHHVSVFHTGEECLKHISEGPDVVILDMNLNAIHKEAADGLQILQSIKKHSPDTHVIMLSSQESYSKALQTIQKGAEQYVIKDASAF